MLDRHQLVGHVALPLPLVSPVPAPGALTNVTLVCARFDYTCSPAKWSSHCVVYQLFGHAVASLQDVLRKRGFSHWKRGGCTTSPLRFF